MIHEQFDLARWINEFPLDGSLQELDRVNAPEWCYRSPGNIDGPGPLALTEQMRERAGMRQFGAGVLTPVDYLIPCIGEPSNRAVSKIGGLPYRRKANWPRGSDGKPLSFIAQICFADSLDILPSTLRRGLRGDVLLIFQEGDWILDEDPRWLRFEWANLGIPDSELIQEEALPEQLVRWRSVYFQVHRSVELRAWESAFRWRAHKDVIVDGSSRCSKIGGVPVWQQSELCSGTFFAALHSINPYGGRDSSDPAARHPFPNLARPFWWHASNEGFFMLGDVGTLYLVMEDDGSIAWSAQCG